MSEWLELQSLGIGYWLLALFWMGGGLFAGVQFGRRWGSGWGWLAGIAVAILLVVVVSPAQDLLVARGCQIEPVMDDCG